MIVTPNMLHRRRVRLHDMTLEGASLFPFFDDTGRIRHYMLVWPASPWIVAFRHRANAIRFRFFWPIEIDKSMAALSDLGRERATVLGALWHWDPWWVLAHPRFATHPAVPALKATNIPGHGPFRFDLGRGRVLGQVPPLQKRSSRSYGAIRSGWRLRGWPWASRRVRSATAPKYTAIARWSGQSFAANTAPGT